MPRIIIRADGGPSIGMGHVIRCLALADMLKNDFELVFAIQSPDTDMLKIIKDVTSSVIQLPAETDFMNDCVNFTAVVNSGDIVILDGYNFKTEYQKRVKSTGCKLVCIDDLHAWHHVADVVINHADGVEENQYSAEPYTKFYLGYNYILLRRAFLESGSRIRNIKQVRKVFISMGAADSANLTGKFAGVLLKVNAIEKIFLMIGSVNPYLKEMERLSAENKSRIINKINISATELKEVISECDVAICPASTIALECCSVGIGLITGHTSDNQMANLKGLMDHRTAINWGDLNALKPEDIKNRFAEYSENPQSSDVLISNQKKMIDGKSPERIRSVFRKQKMQQLSFRFATAEDADLYFKWTNDPIVRMNSYRQNAVSYQEHVAWFKSKLNSDDCFLYLFTSSEGKPAGQVRIDKCGTETVIGISVDEAFRGIGIGVQMLRMACMNYFEKNPSATISAYIKEENRPSLSVFVRAGFKNPVEVMEQNCKSVKLELKNNQFDEVNKNS